jgi:aspartate racemase
MKRIGLLGGMSWESSAEYYRLLNEEIRTRCGGLHSADLLLRSVNFNDIEPLQRAGQWDEADATAEAIRAVGLSTVGLLATAYTMEQDFYVGRLRERHGLEVVVPNAEDRVTVHDVIYNELCLGIVDDGSRHRYRQIMEGLVERGAEGILLGCTEIDLLVGSRDASVPVFDTTLLHVHKAVELALQ